MGLQLVWWAYGGGWWQKDQHTRVRVAVAEAEAEAEGAGAEFAIIHELCTSLVRIVAE